MRLKDTFAIPQFVIPKHFATVYLTMNKEGEIIMIDKSNEAMHMNYANGCGSAPQPAARKRYVRHISGKGEKWEVMEEVSRAIFSCRFFSHEWCVRAKLHQSMSSDTFYFFPKSEYQLCKPEKAWVNVTKECVEFHGELLHCVDGENICVFNMRGTVKDGYRLRKVMLDELKSWNGRSCVSVKETVLIVEQEQEVSDGV